MRRLACSIPCLPEDPLPLAAAMLPSILLPSILLCPQQLRGPHAAQTCCEALQDMLAVPCMGRQVP